jgi:imidazole glycerol-phosphate synthase subunit HisH
MIAIIDYGVGNVQAFANIYKRLNIPAVLATTPGQIEASERIILPGVGAFDWAMSRLQRSGLRDTLDFEVKSRGKPVLGVCVGMQMMANRSDEGSLPGLGWVPGEVRHFKAASTAPDMHLPHMGWNDVTPSGETPLLKGLDASMRFYFLHSYYFAAASDDCVLATTDYHGRFACGVSMGNVFGVQFHPEKSHQWGISLLKNFAEL